MSKSLLALLCIPLLLLAACPDDPESPRPDGGVSAPDGNLPSPDAAPASLQERWDHECDRIALCPGSHDATGCKQQFACMQATMRADVLAGTVTCEEARRCGQGDDACYDVAQLGLSPSGLASAFQTECLDTRQACSGAFSDDTCFGAAIFADPVVTAMQECLQGACDQVSACVRDAIVATSPTCAGL